MTEETKKTISRDTYLKGFALFTMAHDYSLRADECRRAMSKELDLDDGASHLHDVIYSSNTHVDFDEALKQEGYLVEAVPPEDK